jgi:prepilin-type N-terminal cleavage/methylation domain-containing protein/prepilin-type processing-associated H-X9-DG protein
MIRRKGSSHPGFTLVELLVVIGIIALLISILLPALNRARAQAQLIQCQSNIRQLVTAALLFANDHQRHIPACSDSSWMYNNDTTPTTYFAYRDIPGQPSVGLDWASSLVPYLGLGKGDNTFQNSPEGQSKVFQCPSDLWQQVSVNPGFRMINNVTETYLPISYGYNADISMLIEMTGSNPGVPVFTPGDGTYYSVYAGPEYGAAASRGDGQPMCARIDRVYKAAETLLFADCGVRPLQGTYSYPLDPCDCLYYTTNYASGGRMSDIGPDNWLGNRIPLAAAPQNLTHQDRHTAGVMNIGFCDGHVEALRYGDLTKVRISPWQY